MATNFKGSLIFYGTVLLGCSWFCIAEWPTPMPGVVCPETDCSSCQWGQVKTVDINNCTICACKHKLCQKISCAENCPFGYVKDRDGCMTCLCVVPECTPLTCSTGYPKCPELNGFFKLASGCDSCRCRTYFCPHVRCKNHCPFGYFKDEFGCNNCTCLPECPQVNCDPPCEPDFEYETDEEGCQTCTCKQPPEDCEPVECRSCTDGFIFENGCKTCMCKGKTEGIIDYSYLYTEVEDSSDEM